MPGHEIDIETIHATPGCRGRCEDPDPEWRYCPYCGADL